MKKFIVVFALIGLLNCEEIINEQNITNDTIHLLSPTENSILEANTKIAFHWEALIGATDYQFQVAEPNFSNAIQIVKDTVVQRTDFGIDSLKASHYEWRVRALNSAYETGYTTNGFVVED